MMRFCRHLMDQNVKLSLWLVLFIVKATFQESELLDERIETKEYCLATEPFEAKCLKSEVIVMSSALYGRMRIGRCLAAEGDVSEFRDDHRFVGCYVDVLHILDKRCSGKNQCEIIATTDVDLRNERPCLAGLKSYMEAVYNCVAVVEDERSCTVSASSNPLHIMRSSAKSSKLSCGIKSQPWRLEVPAGQQINISLLDFGQKIIQELGQHQKLTIHCRQYGYIIDKPANKNISICGLDYERKENIYKSLSNVVEIVLIAANNVEESQQVLIGVKAIGCPNLVPPEDTWLRRNNNEAVVGCYSSHQTWHLRCVNSQWIGVVGNCTREFVGIQKQPVEKQLTTSPVNYQVMLIVAIGFLGLVVCVIIIICGVVCMKRYSIKTRKNYSCHTAQPPINQSIMNTGINSDLLA